MPNGIGSLANWLLYNSYKRLVTWYLKCYTPLYYTSCYHLYISLSSLKVDVANSVTKTRVVIDL